MQSSHQGLLAPSWVTCSATSWAPRTRQAQARAPSPAHSCAVLGGRLVTGDRAGALSQSVVFVTDAASSPLGDGGAPGHGQETAGTRSPERAPASQPSSSAWQSLRRARASAGSCWVRPLARPTGLALSASLAADGACVLQSLRQGWTLQPTAPWTACSGQHTGTASPVRRAAPVARLAPLRRLRATGGRLLDAQRVAELPTHQLAHEVLAGVLLCQAGLEGRLDVGLGARWPAADASPTRIVAATQLALQQPGAPDTLVETAPPGWWRHLLQPVQPAVCFRAQPPPAETGRLCGCRRALGGPAEPAPGEAQEPEGRPAPGQQPGQEPVPGSGELPVWRAASGGGALPLPGS